MAGEQEAGPRPTSWIASLGLHGGIVAVVLLCAHHVAPRDAVETTLIELVEPAPPQESPAGRGASGGTEPVKNATPGTLGRRGHDAPRSATRTPAPDPLADLVVSYDRPTGPDPGNEAGVTGQGLGSGLLGDGPGGRGGLGNGNDIAALNVPAPPPPTPERSLARPPRAKHPYNQWEFFGDRHFISSHVMLELTIDPQGVVRDIRVVESDNSIIAKRASNVARHFVFYPALNDVGEPTWGLHRWEFSLRPTTLFPR
jgi:hypothetical protein